MNPAETAPHQRTEQRSVGDSDHRIDAAGDHRLDEDAVDLIGRDELARARQDLGEGAARR